MKRIIILLICFYISSLTCFSQNKDSIKTEYKTVVSKKTFSIGGKPISYTIETGYLAWKDDKDEQKANVFYTAYIKDGEAEGKRPISFAFNGGPGSSSLWLHLGCLGPK